MQCVSSVTYKIIGGAHEIGPIIPHQGLHQGDPLSPYIFLVCVQGLSALLSKFENHGLIHGIKVARSAPSMSHIFFADNICIFCKSSLFEARTILNILEIFQEASGQQEIISVF